MKSSLAFVKEQLVPAALCFAAALALAQTEWLQRFENVTLDSRAKFRARWFPTKPRADVVLIGIDQLSLDNPRLGRWPWNRSLHGNFVQLVGRLKPSVVAWDILFDDASDDDATFAKGIRLGKTDVVLGGARGMAGAGLEPGAEPLAKIRLTPLPHVTGDISRLTGSEKMSVPLVPLGEVADIAFVDAPAAADGVLREVPLVVRIGSQVFPGLSLRSLMLHWHVTPDEVSVRLGDVVEIKNNFVHHRIPIDVAGKYLINFRHTLEGFSSAGYGETYDALFAKFAQKKDVDLPEVTGRILLVGQTADGLTDFGPTPLHSHTPLVLVHANVLENVLNGDFARRAAVWPIALGGFVLTAGSLAFFAKRKFWQQAAFALGVPVLFTFGATLAWVKLSVWTPIVWPVLGFAAAQIYSVGRRVLQEQRAKEQIKGMFGTYVSPALVNRMVASGVSPQLGGHEDEITAYFSDIQGFSSFSEKLPPDRLVELMNEYLTACTDIVQEEGGTLDKYIGDAVVAMFGAPIALPDHAYRACVATQRVHQQLAKLRDKWKAEGERWPEIVGKMQSRIGLNSGPCIIGNMGSRTRFNYTMMGDNVNLAARMESGSKSWGAYSMCTETTKTLCEQHGGDRVVFRPLGRIVVMGRSQPVPIFEIVGLKETITADARICIDTFSAALEKYYARNWTEAIEAFTQSAKHEPNQPGVTPGVKTNPSHVYLGIVRKYMETPPPENWGGVYHMTEK